MTNKKSEGQKELEDEDRVIKAADDMCAALRDHMSRELSEKLTREMDEYERDVISARIVLLHGEIEVVRWLARARIFDLRGRGIGVALADIIVCLLMNVNKFGVDPDETKLAFQQQLDRSLPRVPGPKRRRMN